MFVKCVHRRIDEEHPLGQIHWHKIAKDQDKFNLIGGCTPCFYAVTVISEGEAEYENTDGIQAKVGPGDMVLCFPGVGQRLESEKGMGFGMIAFGGPVFAMWERSGILDRRSPVKHLRDAPLWTKRLLAIPVSDDAEVPERDLLEITRLQQFLAEARLQASNAEIAVDDIEWMEKVRALLRKEVRHGVDLAAIANESGMHYEAFRKRFRKLFKISPRQYHNRLLAETICSRLAESRTSNLDLTERFGFCDEYYFSRFFRNSVGMSPSEFRKQVAVGT